MRAGTLDRRVTLQRRSVTQSDSGEEVVTWVDVATVWARKIEAKGLERFTVQQIVGHAVLTFQIRWSAVVSELSVTHRVAFDNRYHDVTDVREIGRRQGIEFDCYAASDEPLTGPDFFFVTESNEPILTEGGDNLGGQIL